mgnify:CR=1 FL=1
MDKKKKNVLKKLINKTSKSGYHMVGKNKMMSNEEMRGGMKK